MAEKKFSKWPPFSDDVIKKWQTGIFMINTTNFQINTTRAFRKILGRNITLLMFVYKFFIRLP